MADDLGVQFFTAAKAQHKSATKWHLIVLATASAYHWYRAHHALALSRRQ
jgi:hypothetical protein